MPTNNYMQLLKNIFSNNLLANLCVGFICFGAFVALFAYIIAPDSTANANTMHVTIQTKPPGFSAYMLQENNKSIEQSLWSKMVSGSKAYHKETPINHNFKVEIGRAHV